MERFHFSHVLLADRKFKFSSGGGQVEFVSCHCHCGLEFEERWLTLDFASCTVYLLPLCLDRCEGEGGLGKIFGTAKHSQTFLETDAI